MKGKYRVFKVRGYIKHTAGTAVRAAPGASGTLETAAFYSEKRRKISAFCTNRIRRSFPAALHGSLFPVGYTPASGVKTGPPKDLQPVQGYAAMKAGRLQNAGRGEESPGLSRAGL